MWSCGLFSGTLVAPAVTNNRDTNGTCFLVKYLRLAQVTPEDIDLDKMKLIFSELAKLPLDAAAMGPVFCSTE